MGRKIPIGDNPSIHPIFSLSLLLVCIASTISIVSSLCGALLRKKSPPPKASQNQTIENPNAVFSPTNEIKMETSMEPPIATPLESESSLDMTNEEQSLPLPPPPGMLRGAASYHYRSQSTASQGKLASSMSMRVLGVVGIGMGSRQPSRREENHNKKREKNLKHEDSIWKKQIILGEKCKLPDEDEDAILYDEKGNRISTYHPKIPNSLPVSRQTSNIDQDAIPTISQGQERR